MIGQSITSPARRAVATRASSTEAASVTKSSSSELRNGNTMKPQKFGVAPGQLLNVATAAVPFAFRLGSGALASGYSVTLAPEDGKYTVATFAGRQVYETSKVSNFNRPAKTLELYEFEACPFCKKVREAITILDLDVLVYPTPKNGPTWRPQAIELGGKKQFPFLIDPNTNQQIYESDAIIAHLFREYGDGQVPLALRLGLLTTLSCGLGAALRGGKGASYRRSKLPAQPLVFWGYELSPFVKVTREVLTELELPYLLRSCARGSPKRQELKDLRGMFQVPYLEDPNTGLYMFESSEIISYLERTYAV